MFLVTSYLYVSLLASPCIDVQALPKGKPAPCDGILWTESASKKALLCRQVEVPRLKAENTYIIEVMGANETAYEEKIDLLQHEISDLAEENQILKRPRPWYKSAPLWATITGAAGLVLGVYVGVGI